MGFAKRKKKKKATMRANITFFETTTLHVPKVTMRNVASNYT
jgi:hypothetical protein